MAESSQLSGISGKHVCPICQEIFVLPRFIPSCKHVFCENCLFTFVFNLKEKGELGSTFECPVCRIPCKMNESGDVTMEWIQTFPLCAELTSDDLDRSSSQPEKQTCGSCLEERNMENKKYCLDCQGYLCDECATAHLKYKALKNHKLMDQDDNECSMEVFEEIRGLTKCKTHPDYDVELYCNIHEKLMCFICVTTSHNVCKDFTVVSDCSAVNEGETAEIKRRIGIAEQHLHSLKHISEDNCAAVKAKVKSYRRDLQQMKDDIIKRLNDIVDNEHALTKQIIIDAEDKTFMTSQKVDTLNALYKKKMSFLHFILENRRPREIFIFAKSLAMDIDELEKQIYQLEYEFQVADVDLRVTDVMNHVSEKLTEDQLPTSSIQFNQPDDLPTLESPERSFTIDNVDTHMLSLTDNCYTTYSDITIRRDGVLVLCDNCTGEKCGFTVLYDPKEKRKQIFMLGASYCATPTNDDSIIVTVPKKKSISILSPGLKLNQTKQLTAKQIPKGIVALNDDKVAISWSEPPAFTISDLSGPEIQHTVYFTEDSTGRKFKSFDYMAINKKRQYIIQPCIKYKAVYCFSFKQQPVFKYTNNLKRPSGVAVDQTSGSVFVCDRWDDSIHQLSVSGKPVSVIRHETLKYPLSVCYDSQRTCLWVTRGDSHYEQVLCYTQVKTASQ